MKMEIESNLQSGPEGQRYQEAKARGKKTVLFVCTANAVRSQMAEALVNHFLRDRWAAFSAGFLPGKIHPMAVAVLKEIGIEASSQTSKHFDSFKDFTFDKVITLCDQADKECAYYPGLKKEHLPFPDPGAAFLTILGGKGSFRKVRDELRNVLFPYLERETDGTIS